MHKCQGTSQLLLLPGQSLNRDLSAARQRHRSAGSRAGVALRGDRHHAAGPRAVCGRAAAGDLTAGHHRDCGVGRPEASAALAAQGPTAAAPAARRRPRCGSRASREAAGARAVRRRALRDRLPAGAARKISSRRHIVLAYGMRFEALADDGVVMRGAAVEAVVRCREPRAGRRHGLERRSRRAERSIGDVQRRDQEGLRLHLHGHWCDSCVSRLHRALLDAAVRRGALRLRAGRAVRPAVPAVAVPATFHVSVGGADDSDRSRPAVSATTTSSPARSGWSSRSCRRSPCAWRRTSVIFPRDAGASARRIRRTRRVQVVVTNQHKGRRRARWRSLCRRAGRAIPARATVKFAREDEETTVRSTCLARRPPGRETTRSAPAPVTARGRTTQATKSSSIRTPTDATCRSRRRRASR